LTCHNIRQPETPILSACCYSSQSIPCSRYLARSPSLTPSPCVQMCGYGGLPLRACRCDDPCVGEVCVSSYACGCVCVCRVVFSWSGSHCVSVLPNLRKKTVLLMCVICDADSDCSWSGACWGDRVLCCCTERPKRPRVS